MTEGKFNILCVFRGPEALGELADVVARQDLPWSPRLVTSAEGAAALLEDDEFAALIVDHDVTGASSLMLLERLSQRTAAVLLVAPGQRHIGIEALKQGYTDYVEKDDSRRFLDGIAETIDSAMRAKRVELALHQYQDDLEHKVRQRTEELDAVNRRLRDEIREKEALLDRLRSSESRYRAIFDTTGSATIIFNRRWEIELANFEAAVLFGLADSNQLRGLRWIELLADRARDRMVERQGDLDHREHREETKVYGRDGRIRRVIMTVRAIPGTASYVASLADITARRDAEEQRLRFETMMIATPDLVSYFDKRFNVQYVNPSGRELLGVSQHANVARMRASDFYPREEWDRVRTTALAEMRAGGSWTGEVQLRTRSGDGPIPVQQVLMAHPDASGEVAFYSTFIRDLRERRELETRLRHSQKQEVIGRMAGGIAHDFNNLLTAIMSSAELLTFESPLTRTQVEAVEDIRGACDRASSMTRQLLALAKKQFSQPRVVDLNQLINDVSRLLGRLMPAQTALEIELRAEPGNVFVDPGQIEQVIMNLAINARDAMPDGGTLTIQTRLARHKVEGPTEDASVTTGQYVVLEVSDNGTGMTREVQERAFEPFFTTRPRGEGTGLGLATSLGIVRQAGGDIELQSSPGDGTIVRVLLPRSEHGQPKVRAGKTAVKRGNGERVLLVEDDDVVRRVTARTLEACGYTVYSCASCADARRWAADPDSVNADVAVLDVVLPDGRGPTLMKELRAVLPELPVVLTSGYTEKQLTQQDLRESGGPLLEKPFTPESLSEAVYRAIEIGRGQQDGTDG